MLVSNLVLWLAALIMGFPLVVQLIRKVKRTPCMFVWGCLFFGLFIVSPLLLHSTSDYAVSIKGDHITDESIYLIYSLTVLISAVFYAGVVVFHGVSVFRPGAVSLPSGTSPTSFNQAPQLDRLMFFAAGWVVMFGLALFIRGTGMSVAELLVASRFDWYTTGNMDRGVLGIGLYFMAFAALFVYYDTRYLAPRKWFSLLVYGSILAHVVVAGGRKGLLYVASGAIAGFYDRMGGRWPANWRFLLGLLLILFLTFSWQFGRSLDWENTSDFVEVCESFLDKAPQVFAEGDATYFYRASLDAIRLNRDEGVLFPFGVLRRLVFMVVPDEWTMGLKPEGLPISFSREMGTDTKARAGNLPPGLVGMFVLSFGLWAGPVILALFTNLFVFYLDLFIESHRDSPLRNPVFATFAAMAILFMRGSTGGVYFMIFNLGLAIGLTMIHTLYLGVKAGASQALVAKTKRGD